MELYQFGVGLFLIFLGILVFTKQVNNLSSTLSIWIGTENWLTVFAGSQHCVWSDQQSHLLPDYEHCVIELMMRFPDGLRLAEVRMFTVGILGNARD